jgi:hypothetical protein
LTTSFEREPKECSSRPSALHRRRSTGRFKIRLKFWTQAYCGTEVRTGEEAAEVAKKVRKLAVQAEARSR